MSFPEPQSFDFSRFDKLNFGCGYDKKPGYLNVDVVSTPAREGLMGAVLPGEWLPLLSDGSALGPRPAPLHQRYVQLNKTLADSWRVTNASSLFDYAPGASTAAPDGTNRTGRTLFDTATSEAPLRSGCATAPFGDSRAARASAPEGPPSPPET